MCQLPAPTNTGTTRKRMISRRASIPVYEKGSLSKGGVSSGVVKAVLVVVVTIVLANEEKMVTKDRWLSKFACYGLPKV